MGRAVKRRKVHHNIMPRRGYKRIQPKPDKIYESYEVAKLINYAMKDGKKSTVASLVYKAFDRIKKDKLDPIEVLHKAIENTAPKMEVRPRRVGGASYLVPTETRQARKLFLALNWIIKEARKRSNKQFKTFDHKLYAEIVDAASNQGGAVEKKANIEKLAEANRAFAHFKW